MISHPIVLGTFNPSGLEVDDTIFPQEFIIDYIKVYKTPTH